MAYACRVVLDSAGPNGARLTTLEVTFPRFVLAEFNTHRVFSRSSASSRAIPVAKTLARLADDPFTPIYWGRKQAGMQAEVELTEEEQARATALWRLGRDAAAQVTEALDQLGVHKQIANRPIEPYAWHTVIVSSTYWRNFANLRVSRFAQPEFFRAAAMMKTALADSTPTRLAGGEWHLPFVTGVDEQALREEGYEPSELVEISAARCARVSYLTHDGKRDPEVDRELYASLLANRHMSPLEHPARALSEEQWHLFARHAFEDFMLRKVPMGNFHGWAQHRKEIQGEDVAPSDSAS